MGLVRALTAVICNTSFREYLRQAAVRTISDRFSMTVAVHEVEKVYDKGLGPRRNSGL